MNRLVAAILAAVCLNLFATSAHAACASITLNFTAEHDWGSTEGRMSLVFERAADGKVTGIRIDNFDSNSSDSSDPTGSVQDLIDHGGGRYTFASRTGYAYDLTIGSNCTLTAGTANGHHPQAGEVRVTLSEG